MLFTLSASFSGFNKRIEYEPGTGSLALFPSMHLETCDEPITSIRASIELETNHIGKGCDRDTYSEKSLHKLCGKELEMVLVSSCFITLSHIQVSIPSFFIRSQLRHCGAPSCSQQLC